MTTKYFLILTILLGTCLTACQATPRKPPVEEKEALSSSSSSTPLLSEPVTIPPASAGPALYAIMIADTRDRNIGESTQADLNNIKTLVENISKQTQLPSYPLVIQGSQLSRQAVVNMLTQLSVTERDVVIFYYSGHGTRGRQAEQRESKWPYLCVDGGSRCTEKDNRLDLDEVVDILKQKGPRFFIAMADACNDLIREGGGKSWGITGPSKPDNYRKLFLEPSGVYIIASGSKVGQVSVGDEFGGKFTNQFLKALYTELGADYPASWGTIMQRAVEEISYHSIEGGEKIQQPQFELLSHSVVSPPSPTTQLSSLSVPGLEPVPPVPEEPIKPSPVNSEEIHLEILPSHRLSPGEAAQLAITATQSGYLFVFDAENNGSGALHQVFPSPAYQERSGKQNFQLPAHRQFLLPDERYFELAVNLRAPPEVGPRSLVALLITDDRVLDQIQEVTGQPVNSLTDWLTQRLRQDQWFMTMTNYEIIQ